MILCWINFDNMWTTISFAFWPLTTLKRAPLQNMTPLQNKTADPGEWAPQRRFFSSRPGLAGCLLSLSITNILDSDSALSWFLVTWASVYQNHQNSRTHTSAILLIAQACINLIISFINFLPLQAKYLLLCLWFILSTISSFSWWVQVLHLHLPFIFI